MASVAVLSRAPWRCIKVFLGRENGSRFHGINRLLTRSTSGGRSGQSRNNSFLQKMIARNVHQDYRLVYEGPLSKTVKYIKTFSLATCVASLIGTPILIAYGKESVPMAGKIAVGATVLLMGMSTTFILHWFTRVYVHRMFYNPVKGSFAVETMNIVARKRTTYFPVEHIQYPLAERAFSTFSAQGKNYFLHMELKEAELAMGYVKERNVKEMQK